MSQSVPVAVPRKGRPLEAVFERLATITDVEALADSVVSTLRYEKAVTKGDQTADRDLYDRLAAYSEPGEASAAEYTLLRDDRDGYPRRIVFDSATVSIDDYDLRLIGREEPFRSLRTHSASTVLISFSKRWSSYARRGWARSTRSTPGSIRKTPTWLSSPASATPSITH